MGEFDQLDRDQQGNLELDRDKAAGYDNTSKALRYARCKKNPPKLFSYSPTVIYLKQTNIQIKIILLRNVFASYSAINIAHA